MKWMKAILALSFCCVLGLGLTGCGGGDDDKDPLVGTWNATAMNGQTLPDTITVTIIFRDNGTCQETTNLGGEIDTASGTWSADSGVLTIVSDDGTENIAYTVSGDTLTITTGGDVITLKRK